MKAIGYIRVSTIKQEIGPEVQRVAIQAKGVELDMPLQIYEECVSGADPLRIELRRAIDSLQKGDVLIVYCLDRLARDLMFQMITEKEIQDRGARLISCKDEGTSGTTPEDQLMRRLIGVFADYERIRIKERTKAAAKRYKAEGKVWGSIPFGYRKGEGGKLIEDAGEQQTIRQMKLLRTSGQTFHSIAQTLNDNGVKNRKGTPWRYTPVYNILSR